MSFLYENNSIKYHNDVYDSHQGEISGRIVASTNIDWPENVKSIVGQLDYGYLSNENYVVVKDINVRINHRRQKIGTKMIETLIDQFENCTFSTTLQTQEGKYFFDQVAKELPQFK